MALLRPVKKGQTHNTSWELTEYLPTDVRIKEEDRYKVAKECLMLIRKLFLFIIGVI